MTLDEVKTLLHQNNISFHQTEYSDVADFWRHIALFPKTSKAKPCKVVSIVILSNNQKKNIELQFNDTTNGFVFEELWFGEYSFEMFDTQEEYLASEIISSVLEIIQCKCVFISANDLKNKRWLGDAVFDYEDTDDLFGNAGYQKALRKIEAPKKIFSKIFGARTQYEIFDWNTYRCIIK